jgi:hypothetical protein
MDAPSVGTPVHHFRFFRAGGVDQVQLQKGADLLALDQLDPKLWVALACPATSIEYDARFLKLLDADADGRIRVGDVLEAVKFLRPLLKNPEDLIGEKQELPLSAIDERTPEGRRALEAARNALVGLDKREALSLTVDDVGRAIGAFYKMPVNGDGVVTAHSTDDPILKKSIEEIASCTGGEKDRSGGVGVGKASLDAFYTDAAAYLAWIDEPRSSPEILPLGDRTGAAWELVRTLEPKVDDFFSRVRLAAFDPRAAQPLNRDEKEFAALATAALSAELHEVAGFPLARIEAGRPLPGNGDQHGRTRTGVVGCHALHVRGSTTTDSASMGRELSGLGCDATSAEATSGPSRYAASVRSPFGRVPADGAVDGVEAGRNLRRKNRRNESASPVYARNTAPRLASTAMICPTNPNASPVWRNRSHSRTFLPREEDA